MTGSHSSAGSGDEYLARVMAALSDDVGEISESALRARFPGLTEADAREVLELHAMIPELRPVTTAKEPPIPERLGEFRIIRRVARGGMGDLYEAVQEPLGRRVAVKTIRSGRTSPAAEQRFFREQRILARLHQTHIVPIHTAGRAGMVRYFAMPYVDGVTLETLIRTARRDAECHGERLPEVEVLARSCVDAGLQTAMGRPPSVRSSVSQRAERVVDASAAARVRSSRVVSRQQPTRRSAAWLRSVVRLTADLARSLQHVHDVGILHRDLKPSNLMVDRTSHGWIIDFGLGAVRTPPNSLSVPLRSSGDAVPQEAPLTGASSATNRDEVGSETRPEECPGTPAYMAAEQFDGRADERTDVRALGVTLFELITLRRAFAGSDSREIEGRVRSTRSLSLAEAGVRVSADLNAIVRRATAVRPDDRYGSAAAFADDLECWLRGTSVSARNPSVPERLARWALRNPGWASAFAMTACAAIIAVTGYVGLQDSQLAAARRDLRRTAEASRENRRAALLQEIQRVAAEPPAVGWSAALWRLCVEAAAIRPGSDLQELADAALSGVDGEVRLRQLQPASSVSYSASGQSLLVGGIPDSAAPTASRSVRLPSGESAFFEIADRGPVGFLDGHIPVQLCRAAADRFQILRLDSAAVVSTLRLSQPCRSEVPARFDAYPATCLSASGRLAAASVIGDDGQAATCVWDVATGHRRRSWPQLATAIAISPDDRFLATGHPGGLVICRELEGSETEIRLQRGRATVEAVAFGPAYDQSPNAWTSLREVAADPVPWRLASGDQGGDVLVWDLTSRLPLAFCHGHRGQVTGLAFSPGGELLASGGRNQALIWNAASGRHVLSGEAMNTMTGVAWSPDGSQLAVSGRPAHGHPGGVVVFRIDQSRGIRRLRGLSGQLVQLVMDRSSQTLAVLSSDWQIGLWDLETGRLLRIFHPPPAIYSDNAGIALSHNGTQLAFAAGTRASLWETRSGAVIRQWSDLPPGLQDAPAFTPRGELLLLRVETLTGNELPGREADWRSNPRVCRLRNLSRENWRQPVRTLELFNRVVFDIEAADDGSGWAVEGIHSDAAGDSRYVVILDAPSGVPRTAPVPSARSDPSAVLRLDPFGDRLACDIDGDRLAEIISCVDGRVLRECATPVHGLSPGGRQIASFVNGRCEFRSPVDDEQPRAALGRLQRIAGSVCRFSFDGRRAVWGNADGSVCVCELQRVIDRLNQLATER